VGIVGILYNRASEGAGRVAPPESELAALAGAGRPGGRSASARSRACSSTRLGFGRLVAPENEAPNMLAYLVRSG
jgi:hypothetical protein